MKKIILTFVASVVIIGGIITSMFMMNRETKQAEEHTTENIEVADKVTDECIDEYDEIQLEEAKTVNSEEVEKISPNAVITFEKFYKGCEHTISRYEEVENNLVNATKEDIEEKYNFWDLKKFSKEKIVLRQEVEGECGEHYMLRDVDGMINIYKLDENGNETLIEETDISTEYLTETDMIDIENGLIVYGRESLNKLLEDFE